jgi:hypothetical protein
VFYPSKQKISIECPSTRSPTAHRSLGPFDHAICVTQGRQDNSTQLVTLAFRIWPATSKQKGLPHTEMTFFCDGNTFECPFDAFDPIIRPHLLRAYDALMSLKRATRKVFVTCHEQAKKASPTSGEAFLRVEWWRRRESNPLSIA